MGTYINYNICLHNTKKGVPFAMEVLRTVDDRNIQYLPGPVQCHYAPDMKWIRFRNPLEKRRSLEIGSKEIIWIGYENSKTTFLLS